MCLMRFCTACCDVGRRTYRTQDADTSAATDADADTDIDADAGSGPDGDAAIDADAAAVTDANTAIDADAGVDRSGAAATTSIPRASSASRLPDSSRFAICGQECSVCTAYEQHQDYLQPRSSYG